MTASFPQSERTRLRRRPQRGAYDEATVFGILDSAVLCHIAYVLDGQATCTPTAFWRDGRRLFWHGSAASGALRAQLDGQSVCVTVSLVDGFLLGRSGFSHSITYRSVMAFGVPEERPGLDEKRRGMNAFIDRLYPGRSGTLRPIQDDELHQIVLLSMELREVSAKVRTGPVAEKAAADWQVPGWAGELPLRTVFGTAVPDTRLAAGTPWPEHLARHTAGSALEDALRAGVAGAGVAGAG